MPTITINFPPEREEKVFRTYHNYVSAFAWLMEALNPSVADQVKVTRAAPGFARPARGNRGEVTRQLQSAWATEMLMQELLEHSTDVLVRYANVWTPVQGYYAVYAAGLAWLRSMGSTARTHTRVLNELTSYLRSRRLAVAPWNATCSGTTLLGEVGFSSIDPAADLDVSNLTIPRDVSSAWGVAAKALKTTRDDQLDDALAKWRRENKKRNVPRAVKEAKGESLEPTSVLHLLYRMRIRSNYREADSFAVGAGGGSDSRTFYEDQLRVVGRTALLFETLVCGVLGESFLRTALKTFGERTRGASPAARRWKSVS